MAWDDAPPKPEELKLAQAQSSWDSAPPTSEELQAVKTPGSSPDSPIDKDIYDSSSLRRAASYGNPEGILEQLKPQGYQAASKDPEGNPIFQGADQKWYRDQNNFFSKEPGLKGLIPEHPINYLQSKEGKALPIMGMIGGGVAGGAAGGPGGAVAGAGGGAFAGELARQQFGKSYGTYKAPASESLEEAGTEGLMGAMGEIGGQAINKVAGPYIKEGLEQTKGLIKSGISKVSSLMSGVPEEAVARTVERPGAVLSAERPGASFDVGKRAEAEIQARNQEERKAISAARKEFAKKFGDKNVDVSSIAKNIQEFRSSNAPTEEGFGALSPQEQDQLSNFEKKILTTEKPANYGGGPTIRREQIGQSQNGFSPYEPAPGVEVSAINRENIEKYGKPQTQSIPYGSQDNPYKSNPTVDVYPRDRSESVDFGEPQKQSYSYGTKGAPIYNENIKPLISNEKVPFNPYSPPVTETSFTKKARDIQKIADWVDNQVTTFDQNKLPGSKDTKFQAYLRSLRGQLKGTLHDLDPKGLAAADERFSEYADKAKLLKQLGTDGTGNQAEQFVNNIYGRNKTATQDAAEELIPETMDRIKDLAASRAYNKQGPAGSGMGSRAIVGGVLGAEHIAKNPTVRGFLEGMAIPAATSPSLHKQAVARGSQLVGKLTPTDLSQLAPQMASPAINGLLKNGASGLVPEMVYPAAAKSSSKSKKER